MLDALACMKEGGALTSNFCSTGRFAVGFNRIPARYWLGLTATPERRGGLEDLIYHQLGSQHVTHESPGHFPLPADD
jgi:hypothetical protein